MFKIPKTGTDSELSNNRKSRKTKISNQKTEICEK